MDFQRQCNAVLRDNKSVLLIAPTGLGKTRAALTAAAEIGTGLLGTRVIYTLPMRAMAQGIKEQFDQLLHFNQRPWKATVHHGQTPDSQTFREQAIITTIDQYLTAFAGAPLSFTSRDGHSAAGAILTSYSVFDEVHLLDPKAGLPLLFAMLHQRQRWGLLSCVMTATLPDIVIRHLEKHLDLRVVHASETDVSQRDDRRRIIVNSVDTVLDTAGRVSAIREAWTAQGPNGRVIVFCNTVPAALDLYHELCAGAGVDNVFLAHSRFAPADRQKRDEEISERFGEMGKGGILVSTQVVEAGLNISAPVVFSELAPADSLVQRAGRCARFFRPPAPIQNGRFVVWSLFPQGKTQSEEERRKACLPYNLDVMEATELALKEDVNDQILDWQREQEFVTRSLSDFYSAFISGQEFTKKEADDRKKQKRPLDKDPVALTAATALGAYEQAFQSADASQVEKLLRDSVTVNVGVVESFEAAQSAYNTPEKDANGNRLPRQYPETISLRLSTFASLQKEWQVREVVIQHSARSNQETKSVAEMPMRISPVQRIRPGATYLILATEAAYAPRTGLGIRPGVGEPTRMRLIFPRERGQKQQDGKEQTWIEHAKGAQEEARRILDLYSPFLMAWADKVYAHAGVPLEDTVGAVRDAMELATLLHDVGKLNDAWQQAVGRNGKEPLEAQPKSGFRLPPSVQSEIAVASSL